MDPKQLVLIIQLPIILFSVVLHEISHGWMAERFGDDTARSMGRITFNPIPHIDVMGSIVVPVILYVMHSPFLIGWAKPVPVDPYRLNNPKKDMLWVALAGPASNMALALLSSAVLWILSFFSGLPQVIATSIFFFAYITMSLNILLFVFNLFPVPPLDGSRIVMSVLPDQLAYKYAQLEQYGMIIIIVLLATGVFDTVLWPLVRILVGFLTPGYGINL